MPQHDASSAHSRAARFTWMHHWHLSGFLLLLLGGLVLACGILSLLPGLTACASLVQCEKWYPFIPLGSLFILAGIILCFSPSPEPASAQARQASREILAEYVRGWVIFQLFVSAFLIPVGAAMLFTLTTNFAWAVLLGGSSLVLLGVGILIHAGRTA